MAWRGAKPQAACGLGCHREDRLAVEGADEAASGDDVGGQCFEEGGAARIGFQVKGRVEGEELEEVAVGGVAFGGRHSGPAGFEVGVFTL